jgi:isocitrate dehydrogenase
VLIDYGILDIFDQFHFLSACEFHTWSGIVFIMSPIALDQSRTYSIACIPADGIGPEVISAGVEVLKALAAVSGFKLDFEHIDWSSETYKKLGHYIPEGGLERLKKHDAILFGAVGAPGQHLLGFLYSLGS